MKQLNFSVLLENMISFLKRIVNPLLDGRNFSKSVNAKRNPKQINPKSKMNLSQFISDEIISCTFMEHSDIRVVSTSPLSGELVLFKHKNTSMPKFLESAEKVENFLKKYYVVEKNLVANNWNLTYSSHLLRFTLNINPHE